MLAYERMGGAVWPLQLMKIPKAAVASHCWPKGSPVAACRQLVGTRMCLKATAYNKAETMLLHFNALV